MKLDVYFIGIIVFGVWLSGPASAACFPVTSDVVSLGEKSARSYAERSLDRNIENKKRMISSTGAEIGPVRNREMSCKPFPNVLGADEWQCLGKARVCTKS
jgi:hypothetical protein